MGFLKAGSFFRIFDWYNFSGAITNEAFLRKGFSKPSLHSEVRLSQVHRINFNLVQNEMSLLEKMQKLPNRGASCSLVANKHFIEIMAHQSPVSMKKFELQV